MSFLEVNLSIARRSFDVRADFSLERGERLALFGPSGAGKTTLLETVAGLVPPSTGESRLDDLVISLPSSRRPRAIAPSRTAVGRVSLVRQPTSLFPHLDVASNVAYGSSRPQLVAELMAGLELEPLSRAHPAQLSGGQAQRVALARALARTFKLLLLDEPMAAMDHASRKAAWSVIDKRCDEEGASALLVTHDLAEAQAFGERLAVIDAGEILDMGDPHRVVAAPSTRRSAEVVGYQSFVRLRPERLVTGDLLVAIDPTRVHLGAEPAAGIVFRASVTACTPYRAGFRVALKLGRGERVEVPGIGAFHVVGESELVTEVDRRVTLGKEILATAVAPPVVQEGARDREDFQCRTRDANLTTASD